MLSSSLFSPFLSLSLTPTPFLSLLSNSSQSPLWFQRFLFLLIRNSSPLLCALAVEFALLSTCLSFSCTPVLGRLQPGLVLVTAGCAQNHTPPLKCPEPVLVFSHPKPRPSPLIRISLVVIPVCCLHAEVTW